MEKEAFEPTGLIPRSIIRTVDRFVQQLLPGKEKIALQEYRVSRYQILVSIKSLLTLVLIPLFLNSTIKALVFTPIIEHFWNSHQSEIFLNQYQEKRAFSEMHDFSEKMFFESLLLEPGQRSIVFLPDEDQSETLYNNRGGTPVSWLSVPLGFPKGDANTFSEGLRTNLRFVTPSEKVFASPSGKPRAASLFSKVDLKGQFIQRQASNMPRRKESHDTYFSPWRSHLPLQATEDGVHGSESAASLATLKVWVTPPSVLQSKAEPRPSMTHIRQLPLMVQPTCTCHSGSYKSSYVPSTKNGELAFTSPSPPPLVGGSYKSSSVPSTKGVCAYAHGLAELWTCNRFGLVSLPPTFTSCTYVQPLRCGLQVVPFGCTHLRCHVHEQNTNLLQCPPPKVFAFPEGDRTCTECNPFGESVCVPFGEAKGSQSFRLVTAQVRTQKFEKIEVQSCLQDRTFTTKKATPKEVYEQKSLLSGKENRGSAYFVADQPVFKKQKIDEVCRTHKDCVFYKPLSTFVAFDNDRYQKAFQTKSLELAKSYNKQSIVAITNLLGDFLTFFIVSLLFQVMRPELIILKSFLTESVYSLSDTTKSFLLILGMDLLVGFHSPRGWELALEGFLRHIGLPENENFILLFVALFPVFLDTVFKYWIFRYLNKISPSTVVTYHSMIE